MDENYRFLSAAIMFEQLSISHDRICINNIGDSRELRFVKKRIAFHLRPSCREDWTAQVYDSNIQFFASNVSTDSLLNFTGRVHHSTEKSLIIDVTTNHIANRIDRLTNESCVEHESTSFCRLTSANTSAGIVVKVSITQRRCRRPARGTWTDRSFRKFFLPHWLTVRWQAAVFWWELVGETKTRIV